MKISDTEQIMQLEFTEVTRNNEEPAAHFDQNETSSGKELIAADPDVSIGQLPKKQMPRLLVAMDRDKTVQKEILDRHFSRRNRRRDRVRAIMYQERKDAKAREEADDMY